MAKLLKGLGRLELLPASFSPACQLEPHLSPVFLHLWSNLVLVTGNPGENLPYRDPFCPLPLFLNRSSGLLDAELVRDRESFQSCSV
jgi:hypothetical protein